MQCAPEEGNAPASPGHLAADPDWPVPATVWMRAVVEISDAIAGTFRDYKITVRLRWPLATGL